MKLPRYTTGRSNTAELERQRAGVVSPQLAANVEMSKAAVVTTAANEAARTLVVADDVRKRRQAEEDQVTWASNQSRRKVAFSELDNNPETRKQMAQDPDYYMREYDAIAQTARQDLQNIQDPRARQLAERQLEIELSASRVAAEAASERMAVSIGKDKTQAEAIRAMDAGDVDGAEAIIKAGSNFFSESQMAEWEGDFQQARINSQAQDLSLAVREAALADAEAGAAAYESLVRRDDLDPEVQAKAIADAERHLSDIKTAMADERKELEAQFVEATNADMRRAAAGEMSLDELNANRAAGKYGEEDTTGESNRYWAIYDQVQKGIERQEAAIEFERMEQNGIFHDGSDSMRKAQSDYERNVVDGMDGGEAVERIGVITQQMGHASKQTSATLNTARLGEAGLRQALPLAMSVWANPDRVPDLHISKESEALLRNAVSLVRDGVSMDQAIEMTWANRAIDEDEKLVRATNWSTQVQDEALDQFEAMVTEGVYEEPGFGDVAFDEGMQAHMSVEYQGIYKNAYMITGNAEAAKELADSTIQRKWVMTNMWSTDGKEYTVMPFGIPGDSSALVRQMVNTMKDEGISVNDEALRFTTYTDEREAFTDDGYLRVRVMEDGVPKTDRNGQVLELEINAATIGDLQQSAREQERTEERLKQISDQERWLNYFVEGNPYTRPSKRAKIEMQLKNLAREREALTANPPEPLVRF